MTTAIYQALENRLKAFFENENVELYTRQEVDENPIYGDDNFYIEFLPIFWRNTSNNLQYGELDFIVHHITPCLYADSKRMTQSGHFLKHADLMRCLNGFNCTFADVLNNEDNTTLINSVRRVSTEIVHDLSTLVITRHRFSCQVYDYTAAPVGIDITVQLRTKAWIATDEQDTSGTFVEIIGSGNLV